MQKIWGNAAKNKKWNPTRWAGSSLLISCGATYDPEDGLAVGHGKGKGHGNTIPLPRGPLCLGSLPSSCSMRGLFPSHAPHLGVCTDYSVSSVSPSHSLSSPSFPLSSHLTFLVEPCATHPQSNTLLSPPMWPWPALLEPRAQVLLFMSPSPFRL